MKTGKESNTTVAQNDDLFLQKMRMIRGIEVARWRKQYYINKQFDSGHANISRQRLTSASSWLSFVPIERATSLGNSP